MSRYEKYRRTKALASLVTAVGIGLGAVSSDATHTATITQTRPGISAEPFHHTHRGEATKHHTIFRSKDKHTHVTNTERTAKVIDIRNFVTALSETILHDVLINKHIGLTKNGALTSVPGIAKDWQTKYKNINKTFTISIDAHIPTTTFNTESGNKEIKKHLQRVGVSISFPRSAKDFYLSLVNNPHITHQDIHNVANLAQQIYIYDYDKMNNKNDILLARRKYGWRMIINQNPDQPGSGLYTYTDQGDAKLDAKHMRVPYTPKPKLTQQRLLNAINMAGEVTKNVRRHHLRDIFTSDNSY